MSFGYSVGDIVGVGTLCYKVYHAVKDGPVELRTATSQLNDLRIALDSLKIDLESPTSIIKANDEKLRSLAELTKSCHNTLKELETMVEKYAKVSTSKKYTRGALKFSLLESPSLPGVRQNLDVHISTINILLQGFQNSSLGRIENNQARLETHQANRFDLMMAKLDEILDAVRCGKLDPSILLPVPDNVTGEVDLSAVDDELVNRGVPLDEISESQQSIRDYVERNRDTISSIKSSAKSNSSSRTWSTSTDGGVHVSSEFQYQFALPFATEVQISSIDEDRKLMIDSEAPWGVVYSDRLEMMKGSERPMLSAPAGIVDFETSPSQGPINRVLCPMCGNPIHVRNYADHMAQAHIIQDRKRVVQAVDRATKEQIRREVFPLPSPATSRESIANEAINDSRIACPICLSSMNMCDAWNHLESHETEVGKDSSVLNFWKKLLRSQRQADNVLNYATSNHSSDSELSAS